MHTSAGPHTCGAATKFLRVACARSWGAPRPVSPALPRSTSPRPTRGLRSCAEGGEGTGEELPSAAAPPLPPPPPQPPAPPHSPVPASPLPFSPQSPRACSFWLSPPPVTKDLTTQSPAPQNTARHGHRSD